MLVHSIRVFYCMSWLNVYVILVSFANKKISQNIDQSEDRDTHICLVH